MLTTERSEVNLSELQKTWDTQGVEVVENQKESVVGRKALADRTKGVCISSVPTVCNVNGNCYRLQETTRR